MRTAVETQHIEARPGEETQVKITVTNTSELIDGVTVVADGLDQSWIRSADPIVRLFPDETGVVTLDICAPETAIAGDYLVVFRVESTVDHERHVNHDVWVTVPPVRRASLDVVPTVITDGSKARVEAAITNTGNASTTYRIQVFDPTRELDVEARPAVLRVHPGQTLTSELTFAAPRPWFGSTVARPVTVSAVTTDAEPGDIVPEPVPVTFNQRAIIPRGFVTFLILAGIITLWALIFMFVIQPADSGDNLSKALGTDFSRGETTIPIEKIAASVSGTVVSSTEGEGLPRISVEARRIFGPDDLRLLGAAATDEDGNFVLDALLPGDYQLTFSADGFPSRFEHLALESDRPSEDPRPGEEQQQRPQDTLRVTLSGSQGVIAGAVDLPSAASDSVRFVVSAIPVETDPPSENGPEPTGGLFIQVPDARQQVDEPQKFEATADEEGNFEIPGLPTPATYTVRAEIPGSTMFAPVEYEVRVEAGDIAQPNPVRPAAEPGSISGTVIEKVDGADRSLGGVTITVRGGDVVTETITPTQGPATFNVTGLPTPADYVVTFSKEGFTGRTIALPLDAGVDWSEPPVVLVGGLGRVSGTATDENGTPLGGVRVVVRGSGFIGESSTLTTASGSGGGVGSFVVSAAPVPGSYTVTFESDGYEPVTLPVEFDESAVPQQLPPVQLERRTGGLTGVLTLAGGDGTVQIPDITITLDDGVTSRRISPTTLPLGAFAFDQVPPGSYTLEFRDDDELLRVLFRRIRTGEVSDGSTTITLPDTGRAR